MKFSEFYRIFSFDGSKVAKISLSCMNTVNMFLTINFFVLSDIKTSELLWAKQLTFSAVYIVWRNKTFNLFKCSAPAQL